MAELPYMPFFVSSYVLDAGHLTEEEHGAYLRLLLLAWAAPECRLPNDDAWLARRLSRPVEVIEHLYRPIIREFFQTDGNWVWQKRQKSEWEKARRNGQKQSANAKSRWNKEKGACGGNAGAMPIKLKESNPPIIPPAGGIEPQANMPRLVDPVPEPSLAEGFDEAKPRKRRKGTKAAAAAGTRVPPDFVPDETGRSLAKEVGMDRPTYLGELHQFRDHWAADCTPKAVKLDWQAAWRTWCRNWAKWSSSLKPQTPPKPPNGGGSSPSGWTAKKRAEQRIREMGLSPDAVENMGLLHKFQQEELSHAQRHAA